MPLEDVKERNKALENAVGQIEKQFGKGSIMRLGRRRCQGANRAYRLEVPDRKMRPLGRRFAIES